MRHRRHGDEQDKQAFAESAVRALRRVHDLDIVVSRVRTQKDFRDQMHLYQGALYGLSPAIPPQELFPQRSPIRGLFLAGQSTYPCYGIAPAIMSGIFAAEATIAGVLPRRNPGASVLGLSRAEGSGPIEARAVPCRRCAVVDPAVGKPIGEFESRSERWLGGRDSSASTSCPC